MLNAEYSEHVQEIAVQRGFYDNPPPRGEKGEFDGLPPARAELARFQKWQRDTQASIDFLTARRDRLKGIVEREKQIRAQFEQASHGSEELSADDAAGLLAQIREAKAGKQSLLMAETDARDAAKAIRKLGAEIDALKHGLEVLNGRTKDFVRAALVEHAESQSLGQDYCKAAADMKAALTGLAGLSCVILGLRDGDFTRLPTFKLKSTSALDPSPPSDDAITRAANYWRQLRDLWSNDARAPKPAARRK